MLFGFILHKTIQARMGQGTQKLISEAANLLHTFDDRFFFKGKTFFILLGLNRNTAD